MKNYHIVHLWAVAAITFITSCGTGQKTTAEFLDGIRPQYAARRALLAGLATSLPAVGTVTGEEAPRLTPPIDWDRPAKRYNAEIIMFEQLASPQAVIGQADHRLSIGLLMCLNYTGPDSKLSDIVMRRPVTGLIERECTAAITRPYLIVIREAQFKPPRVYQEGFTRGNLVTEVFIIRAQTGELLGSFTMTTQTPSGHTVKVDREGKIVDSQNLRNSVRRAVPSRLAEVLQRSGATFVLR